MRRFIGDFSEGRMIRGVVYYNRQASETMDNGAWTEDCWDDIVDAFPKRAVPCHRCYMCAEGFEWDCQGPECSYDD